jgi:serine/threonine protein kinase
MSPTEGEREQKSGSILGRNLQNYKVIRKVGSGGMGEVYLAEDLRLRRQVAIKQVSGDGSADVNGKKLRLEARAAARLNHPGIAMIYDLLEVEGRWHIVMEFVEGETLAERIQRERLSVDAAIQIALQIAEAIAHAHDHGIIHRDLKPANIRLTPEGVVKVLDFGIAKTQFNPSDGETTTAVDTNPHQLIGTPAYMSPEQMMQKPVDNRTDVYSLGVVLFEMLSGRGPFLRGNFMELAAAVLKEQPPQLKDLRPDVPEDLCKIISRAMSKSRDDRQSSMPALRDDLRAVRMKLARDSVEQRRAPMASNPVLANFPFLNRTADPANDTSAAKHCRFDSSRSAPACRGVSATLRPQRKHQPSH